MRKITKEKKQACTREYSDPPNHHDLYSIPFIPFLYFSLSPPTRVPSRQLVRHRLRMRMHMGILVRPRQLLGLSTLPIQLQRLISITRLRSWRWRWVIVPSSPDTRCAARSVCRRGSILAIVAPVLFQGDSVCVLRFPSAPPECEKGNDCKGCDAADYRACDPCF
jgi:hypothetical protein